MAELRRPSWVQRDPLGSQLVGTAGLRRSNIRGQEPPQPLHVTTTTTIIIIIIVIVIITTKSWELAHFPDALLTAACQFLQLGPRLWP